MAEQNTALISKVALEKPIEVKIAPGSTIAEVIESADIPEAVIPFIVTVLNGIEVTDWDNIWLESDDRLAILVMPAGSGGKDMLRMVAMIAVAVAAPQIAGMTNLTGGALTAAQAGITMVGTMAVNALIPPAQPSLTGGGEGSDPTFWFNGSSNQMKPYQKVPIVYGDVRMYAAAISSPIIFNAGTRSEFTGLYDFGLGNVSVMDVKIGDTSVDVLGGQHVQHVQYPKLNTDPTKGYNPVPLRLMNIPTASMPLSYGLTDKDDSGVATTRPSTQAARVELMFQSGLVRFTNSGDEKGRGVQFTVEVKRHSEPDTEWRAPNQIQAFTGDHLHVDGSTGGALPGLPGGGNGTPTNIPWTKILIDPYDEAHRDANGNIVLTGNPGEDRITVRFEFDRPVWGFDPVNDVTMIPVPLPLLKYLEFDKTPVNPRGHAVVSAGGPAEGVMILDTENGGVRIVELEFTALPNMQHTGVVMAINASKLLDAEPPGGAPFDDYIFSSHHTFDVNTVGTAIPPPNTDPDTPQPDDTEFYEKDVTYTYWIEEQFSATNPGVIVRAGSEQLWVRGVQKPVDTFQFHKMKGTIMEREEMLGFGGYPKYFKCWGAVQKDYV